MNREDERPSWSRTQVNTLRECRRKFFFNRPSSSDGESIGFDRSRSEPLRRLKNRYLWTGSTVHEIVGSVLASLRQGQPVPSTAEVLARAREQMRAAFKASKDKTGERLFEHEYQLALGPEVWRRHWDTVENSLSWFLGSKWVQRFAALGPECWKSVDEILTFDVNGVKAFVKIDCAIESNGRFVLIDWKTSSPTAAVEPGLQVAALYAHETWGADPDQIDAVAVSLLDGRTFHATINEETLMETHLRIEESAQLEEASSTLGEDPFVWPVPSDKLLCDRCVFQRLCYPDEISVPASKGDLSRNSAEAAVQT